MSEHRNSLMQGRATADSRQTCRHCPDCPRSPKHRLGNAWYCSPCLVVFLDWLEVEATPASPLLHQARRLAADLAPDRALAPRDHSESYAALGAEGARAQHIYGWAERPRPPRPRPGVSAPEGWDSLAAFYAARGGARSPEADYGGRNRGMAGIGRQCRWRVSVVVSTGDLYAAAECRCDDHARVVLLGAVEADPPYRDADRRFEGWQEEPRDLDWFRSRAAAPQAVLVPPLPLPGSGAP